ncbi:LysE family translocator [Limnovirga soli]|jgi:threonine/homoserine/homoserine lactone efflux protein|uniref:Lysine transporter LysE n=1 Tax=Limnovirga soli TaxID=2656915 RepID=A0A8J8JVV8_9BACT|nr:LysE family translocator [Limnovirga soli]NNV57785.1 lysine transporter LysE [Limnovirga soli]
MNFIIIFCTGWLVSFLGQLPLGSMSITSTQIAVQENFTNAWKYSIGVAVVEIIYLRLTLSGVDWIMQHQLFFTILGWLTVVVFLVLGYFSFMTARKQHKESKALLLENNINRFILGISMSALNPAQIPFWFIWSSYLLNNGVLHSNFTDFNIFTIGCGTGTISGLALYMYGGNWLITKLNTSNKTLNYIMGGIFILAALIQLYRMLGQKFI